MKKLFFNLLVLIVGLNINIFAQVPSYLPKNGLVGHWPFNGNANDVSGNNFHGTVKGATLTTDRKGNPNSAYYFRLFDSIVTKYEGISGDKPRTISFWSKNQYTDKTITPIKYGGNFDGFGDAFNIKFNMNYSNDPCNCYPNVSNGVGLDAGRVYLLYYGDFNRSKWHHYTYVVENSQNNFRSLKIYEDGKLISSNSNVSYDFEENSKLFRIATYTSKEFPLVFGVSGADITKPHTLKDFAETEYLDDISIWDRALTETEILNIYNEVGIVNNCEIPTNIPKNGLVGYWPFCENADDLSGFNNHGESKGATLVANSEGISNNAYQFDGINDYITLKEPFFKGAKNVSEFTYYFKFKLDKLPNQGQIYTLSGKEGHLSTVLIRINSDGTYTFFASQSNPQGFVGLSSDMNKKIEANKWHQIAVTFNNSLLKLYLDDAKVGEFKSSYNNIDFSWNDSVNSTKTNYIGAIHPKVPGITNFYSGIIDDFGLWNRVLNDNELNKLIGLKLNENQCNIPENVPINGLSGYWSFCNNANDLSGNKNDGTVIEAIPTEDEIGNSNSAYSFNGTTDYISLKEPFFNGSTKVDSFSYFVKFKVFKLPNMDKFYTLSCKEGDMRTITLKINSNGSFTFSASQPVPRSEFNINSITGIIKENQWHNIIVTFKDSKFNLYLDNKNVGSQNVNYSFIDFSWNDTLNSTKTNYFGARHPKTQGVTNHFNGVLDEFGTWTRALTLKEIAKLNNQNVNTTCEIPENIPVEGLIGYWPFCGNTNDESGNEYHGNLIGAKLTNDRYGKPDNAYSFNGVNDYIITTPALPLGSSPRTVAAWFRTTAKNMPLSQMTDRQAISGWGSMRGGRAMFPQVVLSSGRGYFETGNSNNEIISNRIVNDGKWHLIITTYNGPNSKVKMYIDGVPQDSTANLTIDTDNSYFAIGNASWANIPFKGDIDDVCLWNRALTFEEIRNLYDGCKLIASDLPYEIMTYYNSSLNLQVNTWNPNANFQWQTNPANVGWQNLTNNEVYNGVNTNRLMIKSIEHCNHLQPLRLIISDEGCSDTTSISRIVLSDTCYTSVTDTLIINTDLTSVNNVEFTSTIKIYPNPASDLLYINFGNYENLKEYSFRIVNSLVPIYNDKIMSQEEIIDISQWTPGMYLMQLISPTGAVLQSKKLVIQ